MKSMLRLMMVGAFVLIGQMAAADCLAIFSTGELPESAKTHSCCSLCLGVRTSHETSLNYNGLTLGLTHSSMPRGDVMRMFMNEQCHFNGLSVQLLAQLNVGTLRGVALTGLFCAQDAVNGWQCSGLANDAIRLHGVQTAIGVNVADEVTGIQIGILNRTKCLKGLQIGLLNVNHAGLTLPLINFSW